MPPPPVAGGAVMAGVCVTVTVTVGVGVGVAATVEVAVALGVTVVAEVAVALGVTVVVGVTVTEGVAVAEAELPPLAVGGAEPFAEGRNVVGDADGEDGDVQPETAAEPRTVTAPQPAAVSSTRSAVPVMGVRTLFRYPIGQL